MRWGDGVLTLTPLGFRLNITGALTGDAFDNSKLRLIIPVLIKALSHENDKVNSPATLTLGQIGKPAVPALIETLSYGNEAVRVR